MRFLGVTRTAVVQRCIRWPLTVWQRCEPGVWAKHECGGTSPRDQGLVMNGQMSGDTDGVVCVLVARCLALKRRFQHRIGRTGRDPGSPAHLCDRENMKKLDPALEWLKWRMWSVISLSQTVKNEYDASGNGKASWQSFSLDLISKMAPTRNLGTNLKLGSRRAIGLLGT